MSWKAFCLAVVLLLVVSACGASGPELSDAAAEGQAVLRAYGCAACHGENGEGDVGPALEGLFGTEVDLEDGSSVEADEAYLRRAILEPDAQVVAGFTISMPVTSLSEAEVEALIAYIKEL